ncbi:MAG TPA: efflux RND transporter permease subunit [Solirubrobacterales bacterium]|nr:efflux RND transporter permease subunit [Solirubrobacterales bacterium]
MFDALARFADGNARRIGIFAIAFFLLAGALGGSVADRLDPYGADDPATETVEARERLQEAGQRPPAVIVVVTDAPVGTAATRARVVALERSVERRADVKSVSGYYDTHSPAFVSRDRDSTYFAVALVPTEDKQWQEAGAAIADQLSAEPGVVVGGAAVAQEQVNKQVENDLKKAELLAFPLLFLLSLLFFRSLVASVLPLMIGGLAIVGTFLILRLASEFGSISIFALNLTTALGLGLAIDYSLFIVSRYREEIAKSGPGLEAMRRVLATSGRTVFFSSLTVAAALASLLVFPQRFLYSMGLGGALVALFAALISLTVLPAVLTMLGGRVNAGAPKFLQRRAEADARPDEHGFWYRLSRFVMRRPVPVATLSALFLIVLGLPFLGIKFNTVDPTVLPQSASARQAYDTVSSEFPPYRETPIWVDVEGGGPKAAATMAARARRVPGVAEVQPPQPLRGDVTALQVVSANPFVSGASQETVKAIRALPAPPGTTVLVGGATADFIDFQTSLSEHLPIALAIVVLATLVILFLMTGSVVLPIKSLIMNFLNLSAVFGLLVLIFQDGRLEGTLDYTSPGAIEQTMPILLFAVAFGLSTDYAVFLLSRIKEARDNGASESECVAIGLERTGRIVTAAALLFAVAMGAFATSQIIFIKENGVGTALAVLIDASIVRALLVPSLMELLGKWNWWAPAPLRRLHERFGISESGPADSAGAEAGRA